MDAAGILILENHHPLPCYPHGHTCLQPDASKESGEPSLAAKQKSLAPDFAVIPTPSESIRPMLLAWMHPSLTQAVENKPLFSHTFY